MAGIIDFVFFLLFGVIVCFFCPFSISFAAAGTLGFWEWTAVIGYIVAFFWFILDFWKFIKKIIWFTLAKNGELKIGNTWWQYSVTYKEKKWSVEND